MKTSTSSRPTPPATSAWTRKSAPRVGSTVSTPCSTSDTGRAPKRSVLNRLVRSCSFASVFGPTVMIVCPPQIASLIVGVVMISSSRAIGPGRCTLAVVNWHQIWLPSSLRLNWTPMRLPSTAGATLVGSIWPPSKSSRTVPASSRSLMSWPCWSCCPCGSMNWSWPVDPTRSRIWA